MLGQDTGSVSNEAREAREERELREAVLKQKVVDAILSKESSTKRGAREDGGNIDINDFSSPSTQVGIHAMDHKNSKTHNRSVLDIALASIENLPFDIDEDENEEHKCSKQNGEEIENFHGGINIDTAAVVGGLSSLKKLDGLSSRDGMANLQKLDGIKESGVKKNSVSSVHTTWDEFPDLLNDTADEKGDNDEDSREDISPRNSGAFVILSMKHEEVSKEVPEIKKIDIEGDALSVMAGPPTESPNPWKCAKAMTGMWTTKPLRTDSGGKKRFVRFTLPRRVNLDEVEDPMEEVRSIVRVAPRKESVLKNVPHDIPRDAAEGGCPDPISINRSLIIPGCDALLLWEDQKRLARRGELRRLMQLGTLVYKYKNGKPTKRWFTVSIDGAYLQWREMLNDEDAEMSEEERLRFNNSWSYMFFVKTNKTLSSTDILFIHYGPFSSPEFNSFLTHLEPKKRYTWLCITVEMRDERTLDVVFTNCRQVTDWFIGLQQLAPLCYRSISLGRMLWMRVIMKINYIGFLNFVRNKNKDWTKLLEAETL